MLIGNGEWINFNYNQSARKLSLGVSGDNRWDRTYTIEMKMATLGSIGNLDNIECNIKSKFQSSDSKLAKPAQSRILGILGLSKRVPDATHYT